MEQYENYFKNEQEVKEYFKKEVFKFTFMSDNTIFFKSLNPIFIDMNLVSFTLSFYYEKYGDFFDFSNLDDLLGKFQICDVVCQSKETIEFSTMFFSKYVDYRDN